MKRELPILIALAIFSGFAVAAPPTLDAIFPPGGQIESEVEVNLLGKFSPWPVSLWFSEPGVTFTPDPKKAGTGKIKLDKSVSEGPILVRAYNEEGASAAVIFIAGKIAEIREEDKNENTISKAALIDRKRLPLVINGTVAGRGELDSYRVALKEGETLFARVESYGLRAPIDPAINLYNKNGHRLFLVHDSPTNLDPEFAFAVPATDDYVISLVGFSHPPTVNIDYIGSRTSNYRLYLGFKEEDIPARLRPPKLGADSADKVITPGKAMVGTLKTPGSTNRYSIKAKKGELHLVRVEGRSLGFPIDPVLTILKPDGSELRRQDDSSGHPDPEYLWRVAADGDYSITVTDRFSRGESSLRYRLTVTPPQPDFGVTCDKAEYLSKAGGEVEIKATLKRTYGHKGELKLAAKGLPSGVTVKNPVKIPEKDGEFTVTLAVAADAKPFAGPFSLIVSAQGDEKKETKNPVVFSFKNERYRGPYAIDELSDLWLTIPKPAKSEAKAEKK